MKNWINASEDNECLVLNTKVNLLRNIEGLPFTERLNHIKARELGKKIYSLIIDKYENEEFKMYENWENREESFNEYYNKFLISDKLLRNCDKSSFILNKDETVTIMINEDNHLNLQCVTSGLDLEGALEETVQIDKSLEDAIRYAFDEELGYLSTFILNTGSALNASVIIHLPMLSMNDKVSEIIKNINSSALNIEGIYVKDSKVIGNLYKISNRFSVGLTEEQIIKELNSCVLDLISKENREREIFLLDHKIELKDRIFRAYALLKSAILLKYEETINLLSDISLGAELEFIDVDKNKLYEILIKISDDVIKEKSDSILNCEQIRFERAKLVKSILI